MVEAVHIPVYEHCNDWNEHHADLKGNVLSSFHVFQGIVKKFIEEHVYSNFNLKILHNRIVRDNCS